MRGAGAPRARPVRSLDHHVRGRGPSLQQAQQDAFLPHVESGLLTFIGATTENPSFEVIGALLSRGRSTCSKSLIGDWKPHRPRLRCEKVDATSDAIKRIADFADGRAPRAESRRAGVQPRASRTHARTWIS